VNFQHVTPPIPRTGRDVCLSRALFTHLPPLTSCNCSSANPPGFPREHHVRATQSTALHRKISSGSDRTFPHASLSARSVDISEDCLPPP